MRILDIISVIALALAVCFIAATITLAGERRQTLEQVNRDINAYWAQQRFESYQRKEEYNQERQLETLREIEQNTEECKCE